MIFYIAGCYIGMIIDAKHFKGTVRQVNKTGLRQQLTRVALSSIAVIPIYVCPVYLIESKKYIIAILTVKYGIPSFMIGFLLYGYSKLIYERFNLINEEDVSIELE